MPEHGEVEKRYITVDHGRKIYEQTWRYCAVHGWFDLFVFTYWEIRHGECDRLEVGQGVGLELPKAKAMAKAA